jgi:hypothetical protein
MTCPERNKAKKDYFGDVKDVWFNWSDQKVTVSENRRTCTG